MASAAADGGLWASVVAEGGAWGGSTGWQPQCTTLRPLHATDTWHTHERPTCSLTMPRQSALYGSHVRPLRLALCMCVPSSSVLGAVQWSIVCGLAGRVHAAFVTLVMLTEKPPVHGCIKYPTLRYSGTS